MSDQKTQTMIKAVKEAIMVEIKGQQLYHHAASQTEDAAAKAIVKRPAAVYIEQVYEYGDFAALGIGT